MTLFRRFDKPIGETGEQVAARYLKKKGLKVLERNFWTRAGEIDLIVKDNETIVFVEVKTRSSIKIASPEDAVTRKKQRNIYRVAELYLKKRGLLHKVNARFDIVSVVKDKTGKLKVASHFKRAFDAPTWSY